MSQGVRFALAGLVSLLAVTIARAGDPARRDHPIVAGFERFHPQGQDPARGGQLLLGELNCVSCHAPRNIDDVTKFAPVLDRVGTRVKHGYLRQFLNNPHKTKPGTTMPDVLAGLGEKQRSDAVEALVHLLASTGTPKHERPDRKQVSAGRDLFHKVGCTACHETRDAEAKVTQTLPTSVPIAKTKYTVASLKSFLENPLAVRHSGRMPGLLNGKEAHAVASYLLQDAVPSTAVFNMRYAYYEGSWGDKLPDFARIKPADEGKAADFDVTVARRADNMALKFDGYLKIDRDGQYKFWLTSDDGSKLWIDDKLIVSNDGIHAPTLVTNSAFLLKGVHKLTVGVFNGGGGVELDVDISGGGMPRQALAPHVYLTPKTEVATPPKSMDKGSKDKGQDEVVAVDPAQFEKGRGLFATLGCANCHQLNIGGKPIAPQNTAPTLAKLRPVGGCLDAAPRKSLPWFSFSGAQRTALAAALKNPVPAGVDSKESIARTLSTFNCYACHDRDKIGGPEEARNKSFTTVQPEMGDEGRLPPSLNGVGAKLKPEYLRKILDQGSHDRPYMHTRMPRFGDANSGHLVKLFADSDKLQPTATVTLGQAPGKVKADGRHLVGSQAFGCIKCHTFKGQKAEGVQGIDMTLMPARLQRDWFVQYLLDPNKFRPGTRMPAAWPKGEVLLTKILDGKALNQIEGIWVYLSDGNKASLPIGMGKQSIPLIPSGEAIIYRNFIEGGGPRAIGVGYPEKVNVCFDANNLRLAMIWQGAFIDAARHWTDRGVGFEPPLGDNVMHLPPGMSFAALASETEAWPNKSAREAGAQFKGYRLSKDQRPTFIYAVGGATIEDTPGALPDVNSPGLRRTLVIQGNGDNLYYRAAAAEKIEAAGNGWYRVGNDLRVRIDGAEVRQSNGKAELLVRIRNGKTTIVQDYVW